MKRTNVTTQNNQLIAMIKDCDIEIDRFEGHDNIYAERALKAWMNRREYLIKALEIMAA